MREGSVGSFVVFCLAWVVPLEVPAESPAEPTIHRVSARPFAWQSRELSLRAGLVPTSDREFSRAMRLRESTPRSGSKDPIFPPPESGLSLTLVADRRAFREVAGRRGRVPSLLLPGDAFAAALRRASSKYRSKTSAWQRGRASHTPTAIHTTRSSP